MQRQESQKNQEMIVKFLNFCATLIQKNVKGYILRQRHKIIMMHIRRFKAILNGFLQGYRTRQIMKVPDVAQLRLNIIETDDGSIYKEIYQAYGNPQIRQKKIRLIRMIENYLQNGQFYKKFKREKSSQKQFIPNQWYDNEFVSQDQKIQQNYYKIPKKKQLQQQSNQNEQQYYDQLILSEYSEQPQANYQDYIQQYSQIHDKSHSNQHFSGQQNQSDKYDHQQTQKPIQIQNQSNFGFQERATPGRNSYESRPICGTGKYDYEEDDRPIQVKNANNQNCYNNNNYDDRLIITKKKNNFQEDGPINQKNINEFNPYQEERPIKTTKDNYKIEQEYQDDNRLAASITKYQQYEDERPIVGKGQYNLSVDDIPINGKDNYDNFEKDVPPKKQKQLPKKKLEQKKLNKQSDPQENFSLNQNENEPPFGFIQNEDQNDQEKPKQKKKDPKLLENLKKRTKYDPRKAIQEAKKKLEEQQNIEQADIDDVVEQQEKDMQPQQLQMSQKKQVLSQKNLQDKQQLQAPSTNKTNLSATPERKTTMKEQIGECSPKDNGSDQKPKNFLKRKSKQVPLKNPKVDPKTVKSKVKNCWNAGSTIDDPDFDVDEDIPQSPKVQIKNLSPTRKFDQKGSDYQLNYQQQQQQLQQQQSLQQQYNQQNKSQGPLHVQLQLVQENQLQYQINPSQKTNYYQQQKKQSIQLDELERAYYSKYTQKLETTKMNLNLLDQERQQNSRGGVPIIANKSRYFTSFRVNDFERLLAQLEDQYNKLQISK